MGYNYTTMYFYNCMSGIVAHLIVKQCLDLDKWERQRSVFDTCWNHRHTRLHASLFLLTRSKHSDTHLCVSVIKTEHQKDMPPKAIF